MAETKVPIAQINGGTTDGRLTTTSVGVVSSLPPIGTMAVLTGNQNVVNSTPTALTFNATVFNNTVGVSGTQIQIQSGGLYNVTQTVLWGNSGTGVVNSWIRKNGTTSDRYGADATPNNAANTMCTSGSCNMSLVAGDYLEMVAFQSSGGTITAGGAATNNQSMMTIVRIA